MFIELKTSNSGAVGRVQLAPTSEGHPASHAWSKIARDHSMSRKFCFLQAFMHKDSICKAEVAKNRML